MQKDTQLSARAGRPYLQLVEPRTGSAERRHDVGLRQPRERPAVALEANAASSRPGAGTVQANRPFALGLADDIALGAAAIYPTGFFTIPSSGVAAEETGPANGGTHHAAASADEPAVRQRATLSWAGRLTAYVGRMIAEWRREQEIAHALEHLSSLDGYLLRDIGMERSQLERFVRDTRR